MTPPAGGAARLHVAVVHGSDEVYGVVAARDREALLRRLTDRLGRDVDLQLFRLDALRFRALVEEARLEEAVGFYFDRVGPKWDPARLQVETVELD